MYNFGSKKAVQYLRLTSFFFVFRRVCRLPLGTSQAFGRTCVCISAVCSFVHGVYIDLWSRCREDAELFAHGAESPKHDLDCFCAATLRMMNLQLQLLVHMII